MVSVLAAGLVATSAQGQLPLKHEPSARFTLDAPWLSDGGVQVFYEHFEKGESTPDAGSVRLFRPFDLRGRLERGSEPLHLVLGRVAYLVDKDISFFSEAQVRDVKYMNEVAKDCDITLRKDGTYLASKVPANTFRVSYFGREQVQALSSDGGIARLIELLPDAGLPEVVVLQENYDFSKVMGWRTADVSVTWSAHYAVAPGRTLVQVCTMSSLHNAPPFFLGGTERVKRESLAGTVAFIENLRAYRPDAGR